MKKIIKITGLFAIIISLLDACTPDKDFMVGTPQDRPAQIAGTWKLQTVTQIDLIAKNYNFVDPSRPDISLIQQDISDAAPFSEMSMALVIDAANVPTTFTINYGNAPKIFKISSGTWRVDDLKAPGNIKMINGPDTISTIIGGVNTLSANLMTLQLIKYQQSGKPATQYNYNFKKN